MKTKFLIPLSFCVSLFVSGWTFAAPAAGAKAATDKAWYAYGKKDYSTAFSLAAPGVKAGIPEAQLLLGLMNLDGIGIPENTQEGMRLITLAAQNGLSEAQIKLGHIYLAGQDSVAMNVSEAIKWYGKAAHDQEYRAEMQEKIGTIYFKGMGDVAADYHEAAKWYKLAGNRLSKDGAKYFGEMYERGDGVPKDIKKAKILYMKAAAAGSEEAAANLTRMLANK